MKLPKDPTFGRARFDGFRSPAPKTTTSFDPVDFQRVGKQRRNLAREHAALLTRTPELTFRVKEPVNVSVMCLGGMGGSGNVARTCAAGLAHAGHNVHVLSSGDGFYQDARMLQVTTHDVGVPKTPQEPAPSWVEPLTKKVVDHVLKEKIEILDVHYAAGLLEAAVEAKKELAKVGYPLKVVATLHGSDVSIWGKNPKHRDALREQLLQCDDVTCVSHHLASQAMEVFGLEDRPRVIENSIDAFRFHPGQWTNLRARIAPHGERIFCHVSNMRAVKRPIDAIDAFAKVRKAGLDAKLLLVGDGPMMEDMYERAVQHGIADDILCTGPQPPDKLVKFVAASDAVLVTSETESFCLAALEAMACGTPVVGTMCGGLDEIMAQVDPSEGQSSLLAPVGDTDGLARIALDLFADTDRYERIQAQCMSVPITAYPADHQVRGYLERVEDLRPSGLEHDTRPREKPRASKVTVRDVHLKTLAEHVRSTKKQ